MYMYVIYSVSYSRLVLSRSQNKCIQTELNWCCERDSFDDELFTWRQTYKVGNDCLTGCVFFFFSSFFLVDANWIGLFCALTFSKTCNSGEQELLNCTCMCLSVCTDKVDVYWCLPAFCSGHSGIGSSPQHALVIYCLNVQQVLVEDQMHEKSYFNFMWNCLKLYHIW